MTDAPPITVRSGAATDAGLRRTLNEDAFLAEAPLFLVADGMGGHAAGEVASAAVIAEFAQLAGRASVTVDEVREAFERAQDRVLALPEGGGAGAGTTLSGVVVTELNGDGYWLTINLGDSRTYRLSDGALEQVSVDHSYVQELVDSGQLSPEDAHIDSRRNVITRAIGAGSVAVPDFWLLPAEAGDRILVCSDGVSGELTSEQIARVLCSEPDAQQAATRLVHEAMIHGGRDNVTAVVVDALDVVGQGDRGEVRDETLPGVPVDDYPDENTVPREPQTTGGGVA